jgi:hypothetical protein
MQLIYYGSMAVTAFEMFKHRTQIYILFCKNKYLFREEVPIINEKYIKEINLISKD